MGPNLPTKMSTIPILKGSSVPHQTCNAIPLSVSALNLQWAWPKTELSFFSCTYPLHLWPQQDAMWFLHCYFIVLFLLIITIIIMFIFIVIIVLYKLIFVAQYLYTLKNVLNNFLEFNSLILLPNTSVCQGYS